MTKLETSTIELKDVRLYAFHGVLEQERRVGGDYSVSLRVHYNICKAMETDDVNDTLNYAHLLDIIKQEMAVPSNLLEHVAGRIGIFAMQIGHLSKPSAVSVSICFTVLGIKITPSPP